MIEGALSPLTGSTVLDLLTCFHCMELLTLLALFWFSIGKLWIKQLW